MTPLPAYTPTMPRFTLVAGTSKYLAVPATVQGSGLMVGCCNLARELCCWLGAAIQLSQVGLMVWCWVVVPPLLQALGVLKLLEKRLRVMLMVFWWTEGPASRDSPVCCWGRKARERKTRWRSLGQSMQVSGSMCGHAPWLWMGRSLMRSIGP